MWASQIPKGKVVIVCRVVQEKILSFSTMMLPVGVSQARLLAIFTWSLPQGTFYGLCHSAWQFACHSHVKSWGPVLGTCLLSLPALFFRISHDIFICGSMTIRLSHTLPLNNQAFNVSSTFSSNTDMPQAHLWMCRPLTHTGPALPLRARTWRESGRLRQWQGQ